MQRLRAATHSLHQRLERRLDVRTRFSTRRAYRAYLEKMYGFYAGVEARLVVALEKGTLATYPSRRKVPLLLRDLAALGADAESIRKLAICQALPPCSDAASAFGCLYVLEGATLGGRVLLPLAERQLGLSEAAGASYLGSYGDKVQAMWREFGDAVNFWCVTPARQASAEAAAADTFRALGEWFFAEPL
jgi:heme oxygenase